MKKFEAGQTLVVRNIAHSDGTATGAIPMTVIWDEEDCLAAYLAPGTMFLNNYIVEDRVGAVGRMPTSDQRAHVESHWTLPVIRLYLPDRAYSAHLFFGQDWSFTCWYGNLEAPYQRTAIGIDTQDHALDVLADGEFRWRWKDEDEFARRLELGLDTAEHQADVRCAGAEFIEALKSRAPPFDRDWLGWRPPSAWKAPVLPPDWFADFGTEFSRR